ncbi:RNA-binding protein [Dictyobacter sp. S3.2.2.5]|uniref:RNA-binding protein n=1 Tax=Dictyobacter halimunensis TaxID=3026934 RepID=A0ABQ6FIZ2_9CHLR|nr:RNA-binding protein [Dictyobacter sp. S3.2.2.5]
MSHAEQRKTQDDKPLIFQGEMLALDLVNTEVMRRGQRHDLLTTPQDVVHWWQATCQHHPELDGGSGTNEDTTVYDQALLDALKTLRTALRAIFDALVAEKTPEMADISVLNAVLRTNYTALEYSAQGDLVPMVRTTNTTQGLVLAPIALSALSLISQGERKRLHRCENERCILFFYDTTRSATRRWCSLACMDRARSSRRYHQAKQHTTS